MQSIGGHGPVKQTVTTTVTKGGTTVKTYVCESTAMAAT